MQIMAIVLAAGQGKRMKSKLYKVLHAVCGKPMIGQVVDMLDRLQPARKVVVVGHGAEAVRTYLSDRVEYVMQEKQLGTGHAVLQVKSLLANIDGLTIVLCGDTPLITEQSVQNLIHTQQARKAAAAILTAKVSNPQGYGRIIRGARDEVSRIVEQKDCSEEDNLVQEINTGTYCFDNRKLFQALEKVTNHNAQGEYYLTDVIDILKQEGEIIEGYCLEDATEALGVNDRVALAVAEQHLRQRIVRRHLLCGVTIIDPSHTYIDADVTIGMDTVIYPGTMLKGKTVIGSDCKLGPNTEIIDSSVADGATVRQSVVTESQIGPESTVGPFAYLRPGARIGSHVKIGDFVEVKNAMIDDGSKVSHLSYVGDAKIGKNVNVGCGAITVNYDGFNKQLTEIEDDAFVGSNVNLIAPVKVGKGAYVVAGSTITDHVEPGAMAIARQRQTNKAGYASKMKARFKALKESRNNTNHS